MTNVYEKCIVLVNPSSVRSLLNENLAMLNRLMFGFSTPNSLSSFNTLDIKPILFHNFSFETKPINDGCPFYFVKVVLQRVLTL